MANIHIRLYGIFADRINQSDTYTVNIHDQVTNIIKNICRDYSLDVSSDYELWLVNDKNPSKLIKLLENESRLYELNIRQFSNILLRTKQINPAKQPSRCLLGLPDGSEALIGKGSWLISREWLLKIVWLRDRNAFQVAKEQSEQEHSAWNSLSREQNGGHFILSYDPKVGTWSIMLKADKPPIQINGTYISPGIANPLPSQAKLQIGRSKPFIINLRLVDLD
ncbi:MAG: hypothetical protein LCH85_04285 [Chloroflexi bacterium]|nr:hypothetical protein [Chloroflexota bacterium]